MIRNKILYTVLGGAVALGLLGSAAVTFAQADTTSSSSIVLAHHGGMGMLSDRGQALADALGITLEELQAAQLEARNAMIDQAVEDGYLTQEQADQLKANTFGFGRGGRFGIYDEGQYLADALGITVEELQAAQLEAYAAELTAAVEAGYLTQEQADLMLAQESVQNYIDREGIEAQMQAAFEAALDAAIADGAITQEQADALLAQMAARPFGLPGFGGRGGHGGHGGPRGFGGFGGFAPGTLPTTPDTGTNTSTGQGA